MSGSKVVVKVFGFKARDLQFGFRYGPRHVSCVSLWAVGSSPRSETIRKQKQRAAGWAAGYPLRLEPWDPMFYHRPLIGTLQLDPWAQREEAY